MGVNLPVREQPVAGTISRRAFLAAAGATSLGAVGPFHAPLGVAISLPSSWEVAHKIYRGRRFGATTYAHLAYKPEEPTVLWGMLAILSESQHWPVPTRVYSFVSPSDRDHDAPQFVGTVELPDARITIVARNEPAASRITMGSGDLIVDGAAVTTIAESTIETRPAPWRLNYDYLPEPEIADWALRVCYALRKSARMGAAVSFESAAGELVPAPARV